MKIIGFDTNVLITLELQRQPGFDKAKALLEECLDKKIKIYIPIPAFLETEWVLRSYYKLQKEAIIEYFEELIALDYLLTDNKDELKLALSLFKQNSQVSFTDSVIAIQVQVKNYDFLTFDQKLEKLYHSLL